MGPGLVRSPRHSGGQGKWDPRDRNWLLLQPADGSPQMSWQEVRASGAGSGHTGPMGRMGRPQRHHGGPASSGRGRGPGARAQGWLQECVAGSKCPWSCCACRAGPAPTGVPVSGAWHDPRDGRGRVPRLSLAPGRLRVGISAWPSSVPLQSGPKQQRGVWPRAPQRAGRSGGRRP